ncbi:hypothetical protein D3C78_867190 [compost metagenome]
MAKYQYRSLFIGFDGFGNTGDRTQSDGQEHGRTIRVVGTVHWHGNHQHVFTTLNFELAVFDGFTQTRLVTVQPGLSRLVVNFRYGCNLVTGAEWPPPTAVALGLGIGFGDFFDHHVLHFLLGNLVRTERPPVDPTIGHTFLRVLGAAGHGQAQGES